MLKTHLTIFILKIAINDDSTEFRTHLINISQFHKKIAKKIEEIICPQIKKFIEKINSFTFILINDTLAATQKYNQSRVAYDFSKESYENALSKNKNVEKMKLDFEKKKELFEKASESLKVKLIMLHEKRIEELNSTAEDYSKAFLEFFENSKTLISEIVKDSKNKNEFKL